MTMKMKWAIKRLGRAAVLAAGLALTACQTAIPALPDPAGFKTQADFGRATTKKGKTVDLINLVFIGSRWELTGAFHAAGWLEADPITLANIARQGKALLGKSYRTAPFSDLFYLSRKQDLSFQKNSDDIHKRDHLRLWMSAMKAADGRPVWVCAASRDVGIGFSRSSPTLITHKVEVNRDLERDMVVEDLGKTGRIAQTIWLPGDPISEKGGYPLESDGRVPIIALKTAQTLFGW